MEFETKVQSILKNDLQANVKATLFPILIAEFSTLSSHLPTSLPLPSLLRVWGMKMVEAIVSHSSNAARSYCLNTLISPIKQLSLRLW